ncbi:MAG: hypothetical protein ACPGNV_06990 [Mangrovicoccus sp.]
MIRLLTLSLLIALGHSLPALPSKADAQDAQLAQVTRLTQAPPEMAQLSQRYDAGRGLIWVDGWMRLDQGPKAVVMVFGHLQGAIWLDLLDEDLRPLMTRRGYCQCTGAAPVLIFPVPAKTSGSVITFQLMPLGQPQPALAALSPLS